MTGSTDLRTGPDQVTGDEGPATKINWADREKYGFLLHLLEGPEVLLPDRLQRRISVEKTKLAAYQLEQKIVRENIKQMDDSDSLHRPELLESLYSQVSHLDSVLTSLEGQIQVLEAVQKSLPHDLNGEPADAGVTNR
ncbi:uncharacterized protein LOC119102890 [Pollicipes pollicipes]|uniref:uncharacterized protein LOC119102890 n=1 Tax=Pollicipes pollicipes TaxID=41117 RepID=UPI00188533CD|nr:uncharacterized protein LOC119102890 [Pollicipes pollicipes]